VRLITAHRILIGAGIAFFLLYAMVVLMRDHTASGLVHALISLAVAVGLALYYRTLRGWGSRPPS
jgi:hydrogenase maturation factor